MADYSGDLKYRITVDGAEASQAKLSGLGASFKSVASTVAASVAAMVSFRNAIEFAGKAMTNYENAIQATRQLNATLASTGRAAEFTSQELKNMASELQAISNFGDEDILQGVTLQLLRFDAISRDIFPRAQQLVIDLAESMGGVENAARTLGISLADPTLGLTRLRRIGVAFNSTQEAQIKNFVETGKVAEAQAVLMSALEDRFGGLALASVSATTQMKNAWGDYLESVGSSLSFFDGVKRGITAMLVSVAGAHDVTSKSAQIAALETQKTWGEATINVGNIIADISTGVVAVIHGVIKAFDFAGKAIPKALKLAMDGSYLVVASAMNSIVDLIVAPIEGLFNGIDAVYAKITGKSLGITNAFDAVRFDVTGIRADIASSADDLSALWKDVKEFYRTWGDVASGIATGKFSNVDEQIKLLHEGIDAQRKAIEQGLTGIDVPDLDFGDKGNLGDMGGMGGMGGDIAQIKNYYDTVMALNNSTSQQIMDKYNEMRAALDEYLRANTESQEEYQNKLRLGLAEIDKAETRELMAEREKQLSDLKMFVDAVSGLNASEIDVIKRKYAEMRTEAEGFYSEGLISEQAYQSALAQIRQAEGEEIKSFERQRLDFRVQTLAGIAGLESSYKADRLKQIELETENLREGGLTEVEIHAWVQKQKLALETEIDQRRIDQMSDYERYVLDSNKRIMDTLEDSLANSLADMLSGTKSALDVWKSLWANVAQAIIAEISKIIVKALFASKLLKSLEIATGNIAAFFRSIPGWIRIGTGAIISDDDIIGTGAMTQSQGFIGPVNQADFDPFAIPICSAIDNNTNQTTSALDELNNTIMNYSIIPQQQSIDLSPLAHLLDSIMLARQERTDLQSYGVTEMMTNTVIRQERDNRALDSLSERIEKLATAIENNKPQIYTQVIEGVPFHNAIRRAAAVANEL